MGKFRRGNLVFLNWIGDHGHHAHVYQGGKEVLKWDLEKGKPIRGKPTKRLLKLIGDLRREGKL